VTLTSQDAIWRLVTEDVTVPTDRDASEMMISARTVYNAVNKLYLHLPPNIVQKTSKFMMQGWWLVTSPYINNWENVE